MKVFKIFGLIAVLALLASCTEKGCTDEGALNYKITATKDDGSCIYCSKMVDTIGQNNYVMIDFNNSSIHFNDNVIAVEAIQTEVDYNDGGCGTEGCVLDLKLTNLVAEDVVNVQFSSWFQPSSGFGFTYQNFDGINIPAGESYVIPKAVVSTGTFCNSISGAVVTTNLFNISYN